MKRRSALQTGAVALASWVAPGCGPAPSPPHPEGRFAWGVASGDPTRTSVLLWTRLSVERAEEVEVEVYDDPGATELVSSDLALAEPERDGCVKHVVEGLAPGRTYYYRFRVGEAVSPLGRTRTLPEGPLERARLAVVTCSNYGYGYFHAYRRIAERPDLFAIVHLGDSIYEYADGEYGSLRELDPPGELLVLTDYRRRYARYRTDPDLRDALRQHPFLVVWDDHEYANNAGREGALAHDAARDGPWAERAAAARRAFFEWNPVQDETGVHRSLVLGDLARLVLLDTRMDDRDPPPATEAEWASPERHVLGAAQESWLAGELARTDVVHTVLGNQVVMARFPALNNLDAWDGYPAQQTRVLGEVARAPSLPIVVTGDTHSSLVFDLPGPGYDPSTQAGSTGVEWGVPPLASPHLTGEESRAQESLLLASTPHLRWTEQEAKGWVLLDLDRERARAEWWFITDATRQDGGAERLAKVFECTLGARASVEVETMPSAAIAGSPPLAP